MWLGRQGFPAHQFIEHLVGEGVVQIREVDDELDLGVVPALYQGSGEHITPTEPAEPGLPYRITPQRGQQVDLLAVVDGWAWVVRRDACYGGEVFLGNPIQPVGSDRVPPTPRAQFGIHHSEHGKLLVAGASGRKGLYEPFQVTFSLVFGQFGQPRHGLQDLLEQVRVGRLSDHQPGECVDCRGNLSGGALQRVQRPGESDLNMLRRGIAEGGQRHRQQITPFGQRCHDVFERLGFVALQCA